ncbi:hypothetical protein HN51_032278 [Arachis hypogaea]
MPAMPSLPRSRSMFPWKESDRAAAKRATHALADLAKNGKSSIPLPLGANPSVVVHMDKKNEILMKAYRSMLHESQKLQVEEEMLMHKLYDVMSAHGLTKKVLFSDSLVHFFPSLPLIYSIVKSWNSYTRVAALLVIDPMSSQPLSPISLPPTLTTSSFPSFPSKSRGASIGWHSDDNRPYLKQRHFAVVCYLNNYGKDFNGGLFPFQDGQPMSIMPMAGDVLMYTADQRNIHSVGEVYSIVLLSYMPLLTRP